MKLRHRLFGWMVLILLAGTGTALRAQQAPPPKSKLITAETVAADQKILAEIKDHNEIMANLEYLSDMIGARLTGSANLTKASHWTQEKFTGYGLENVHLEPWTIAHAWTRGTARGRIVSPAEHPLTIAAYGWSPATAGVVRGPLVYVKAENMEELDKYKGKLKGAIVITGEPAKLPDPNEPPQNPLLQPFRAPFIIPTPSGQPERANFGPEAMKFRQARTDMFKAEGVAATLTDSGKPHGLLNMTGVGGRDFVIGPFPSAFITSENYSLLWRLMKRGPVEIEIEMTPSFSEKPVEVYNTVAEIKGSEKPDEVVILGAHLDSWDLGTGSTDNGTGSMVVLEAARALEKLGLKPKRTIRFVLFTGEEEGLVGSHVYVDAHKAELGKISAALIHDTGTGRVLSIGLMANYQDREAMDQVMAPLRDLGLTEMSERSLGGSDHASFNAAGVPGFFGIQDPAEYGKTHHSQSDTFDKAHADDLVQGAQVLAVWAYNVAELPEMLPRKPAESDAAPAPAH
jgi:carboxypeptidase Q